MRHVPLALILPLALACAPAPPRVDPAPRPAAPGTLELVESAPIETTLDHADIPDAAAGDEVAIVGTQGHETLTGHEAVATYAMPMIELLPRMTLNTVRVYRSSAA